MTARPLSHPSPDLLRALAAGNVEDETAKRVLAHFEACPDCCLAMTTIGGDGVLRRLRAAETAPSGDTLGPAAPASAPDDVPPELRNHQEFEVLRKLGGGGMGIVYLARDRLTHRQEALKVVNPSLATQPGVAERFLREIRAVVQLAHPSIVTAYGALQVGGLLVLKMEYVPGEDLNTVVKRDGTLSVEDACDYAQQVALGLQYAFDKRMVHRDIKPGNLILARDGKKQVVKILDFGLVKAVAAQGGENDQLTGTGQGMGTPAYMAPEQAKDAARADIRADIYSLGCTLYFLLAGRPPFSGSSPYDIVEAHRSASAAPLNEVRKDVPADLATVVAKMLEKNPARRYQEPADVAQALKPFVTGPARKLAAKSKGGTLAVLLGVASLLVLGGSGAVYWAVSGTSNRSDSFTGAFAHADKGQIPPVKSTGIGDPKVAGDVVARVKNVSGIELVSIPAGSFYMGSRNDDKDAYDDEKPQHEVTISQPFYLGKYKVTRGQFQRFVNATNFQTEGEKANDTQTWKKLNFQQTDEHPVGCVSWNDADAFCQWLAKETGAHVRLPYEAEWEYSCRAVRDAKKPTTKFYFGDDESQLGDYAWYGENSGGTTHPCGQKTPNAFGLYDMHGLVLEWCADGLRKYEERDETDPVGPTGAGASRVVRGGSFTNPPRRCRAASRYVNAPSCRYDFIGFRVLVSR
jgi:formylglycine-generating enzyme required for sulfatase activity